MDLEDTLKTALSKAMGEEQTEAFNVYPVFKRGLKDCPYLRTSDDRIVEYGYEKVLFSKQSDYQLVQIVQTVDFGPMLILDGMVNLAESDTEEYTHTLMNLPAEDYSGKNVLILGGGDGALIKVTFAGDISFATKVSIGIVRLAPSSRPRDHGGHRCRGHGRLRPVHAQSVRKLAQEGELEGAQPRNHRRMRHRIHEEETGGE